MLCYLLIQHIGVCHFPSISSLDSLKELWEKHTGRVLTSCLQIAYHLKSREREMLAFMEHVLHILGELHAFSYLILLRALLDRHYLI